MLTDIFSAKTNILGTVLIAAGSSLLTVLVLDWRGNDNQQATAAPMSQSAASSVVECGDQYYSPVQRQCVSRDIFDGEMKRLFAALGIDASIYSAGSDSK